MRPRTGKPRVRLGAGILIVSPEGRLLIVEQEHGGVTDWGPLGGGLEHGESIQECAVREAHEESGLRVKLIRLLSVDQFWRADHLDQVGFVFLAEPEPWPQQVTLPALDDDTKFLNYKWITKDEVPHFVAEDSWEFWAHYWPLDVQETLVRQINFG